MYGQNINVQQSQQNVHINVPVIERNVYIERFRTIYRYRDRPQPARVARRLDAPIQLLGYLWVHTQDLGDFRQHPHDVIRNINAQNPYGRNNWRIPTCDELRVMENNANLIGLGDGIYMATSHSNGILRLVSTGLSVAEQNEQQRQLEAGTVINGIRWANLNVASGGGFVSNIEDLGGHFNWYEARNICPPGWRLPTDEELRRLSSVNSVWTTKNGVFGRLFGTAPNQLFLPAAGRRGRNRDDEILSVGRIGVYWSSTMYYHSFSDNLVTTLWISNDNSTISAQFRADRKSVRCVAN